MKFKPYPEYKDSGVPWLGEVPKHWSILPNRALFEERNARNSPIEPLLSVTIKRGVIQQTELIENTSKKDSSNEDKSKYKLVLEGDIPYNKMRMWQGAVGASRYRGIVSPAYIVLRPRKNVNSWYFHYLLRTPAYTRESHRYSYGICDDQLSLRFKDFKVICSPLPTFNEQKAIVQFIKLKNIEISRFIRNKKRLVELLKEQKQAIINQAVTRGIDPNVRLKPSDISWMPKIAEHWDVVKLGFFINLLSGFAFPSEGFSTHDGDIKLLRGINIAPGDIRWDQVVCWPAKDYYKFHRYQLESGDIVVGMDRPWISKGMRVAEIQPNDIPALLLQRVARIRAKLPLNQRFLSIVLSSKFFVDYFSPILTGISVPHISPVQITSFRFGLPPKEEQYEIVNHLAKKNVEIDATIIQVKREIELIQEYRTRLIADVVTGKVDVRNIPVEVVSDMKEIANEIESEKVLESMEGY